MSDRVTRLVWLKNGGLQVHLQQLPPTVIDTAELWEPPLERGRLLSEEELARLAAQAERFEARRSAAQSLARNNYSAGGLVQKLRQKGISQEAAEEAVDHYRAIGYLQDDRFAESLAERLSRKGCGRRRILDELRRKGVDGETAEAAMEALPADREVLAGQLAGKYRAVDWSDRPQRDRAVRALLRNGFDWEDISALLRQLLQELP
ncbi:MAG: regulatory protein RecX [Clostridia bacterium]|nr:regulatory protein RecX [Clostridia bacterium]